jgi:hypothetical protein
MNWIITTLIITILGFVIGSTIATLQFRAQGIDSCWIIWYRKIIKKLRGYKGNG